MLRFRLNLSFKLFQVIKYIQSPLFIWIKFFLAVISFQFDLLIDKVQDYTLVLDVIDKISFSKDSKNYLD